jgi:hypothetical protein
MAVVSETLRLMDGTTALIDPQFGVAAADSTVTHSAKGYANSVEIDIQRDTFNMITFGTAGGWEVPLPRYKVATITMGGFMSVGGAMSDPLALININTPTPYLMSVTPPAATSGGTATAVTLGGNCIKTRENSRLQAQDASGRQEVFRNSGPMASLWIVA